MKKLLRKYMKIKILKNISSLCLILCFFMPLSQCTITKSQPQESVNQRDVNKDIFVPIKTLSTEKLLESLIIIIFFFFSVPFILIQKKLKRLGVKKLFNVLEILLSLYVAYVLYFLIFFLREPLAAGYLAIISICTYSTITVIQLIQRFIPIRSWGFLGIYLIATASINAENKYSSEFKINREHVLCHSFYQGQILINNLNKKGVNMKC